MSDCEKTIAEVIPAVKLPSGLAQFFSYKIPVQMLDNIRIGSVVRIPFRKETVLGLVRSFSKEKETRFKLKEISEIVDEMQFSEEQLLIADYVSGYYYAPESLVIKMMLPTITKKESRLPIRLNPDYGINEIPAESAQLVIEKTKNRKQTLLIHNLQSQRHDLYRNLIEAQKGNSQTLLMFPEYFDIYSAARFYIDRLGKDDVSILCSDITKNQYFTEWQKVRSGRAKLVISTRQGIFAPFKKLGLIIVDEEHNSSYKQWDQNPRYQGVNAAIELAKIHDAKIMLSSPTPTLESYCRTREDFTLIDISEKEKTPLTIIDFETERKSGNYSFLPEKMKDALLENIYGKKQALIFIPRLGEKTFHQCKDCGYIAQCETCENPLIGYKGKLYCPRCKHFEEALNECPKCHGQNIGAYGGGSQRVFQELGELFENKNINIAVLDSGSSGDGVQNQKVLEDFQRGKIDILVGTQMLWKNWNLENLKLIGIIFPEIIFGSPGFRSGERSWQFLSKVYGYSRDKDVIIETFKPEHRYFSEFRKPAADFLEKESETRQTGLSNIQFPPFGRLIKLILKDPDAASCEKEARWQYALLQKTIFDQEMQNSFEVMPPFPAQNYREFGKFRWHIIIKQRNDVTIGIRNDLLSCVTKNWIVDIDPDEIL